METAVGLELEPLALVHKALGDVVRMRILQLLPRNPNADQELYNVNALSRELRIPQPTVSHHLRILKHAGVVRYVKKSNSVFYYLDVKRLQLAWQELNRGVLNK